MEKGTAAGEPQRCAACGRHAFGGHHRVCGVAGARNRKRCRCQYLAVFSREAGTQACVQYRYMDIGGVAER